MAAAGHDDPGGSSSRGPEDTAPFSASRGGWGGEVPEPAPAAADEAAAGRRAPSRGGSGLEPPPGDGGYAAGGGQGGTGGGGEGGAGGGLRRFAKLWGFLAFAIAIIALGREAVLPFVFALLLAYILAPLVRRISLRLRVPRGVAILLCYALIGGGITLFLAGVFPRLVEDVERVGREAPELYTKLTDVWAPGVARWIEERFPTEDDEPASAPDAPPVVRDVPIPPDTQFLLTPLPDGRTAVEMREGGLAVEPRSGGGFTIAPAELEAEPRGAEEQLREWAREGLAGLQDQLGQIVRFGQAVVVGVISSVFSVFLVFLIAGFVLVDPGRVVGFVRSLVPASYRGDFDRIAASVDRGLAGVIRGQLIICLLNAVLTYVGLVLFDVNYALTLAVIAGVLSIIPILGVILSTVPIVLTALVSGDGGLDLTRAFFVLLWIIGINFLEGNVLSPKILGSAARIHPLLVIFALLVGMSSFGLAGALLAVPVASVVQVLFLHLRSRAWEEEEGAAGGGPEGSPAGGAPSSAP